VTNRNDENLHWLALGTIPKIGPIRYRQLLKSFGSPEKALSTNRSELEQLPDIGPKLARIIKDNVDYKKAEEQLNILEKSSFSLITIDSAEYPEPLKNIYDPPPFFFCDGDMDCLLSPAIAMVGSRSLSVYGRMMAEKLARDLATAGFTVVSGFARGIDTICHRTAIEAGGKTAAVFGCGLDIIYPPENKGFYRNLVLNGCAISEFFLREKPDPKYFPRRNRIISGLSLGVLVIEAGRKSGALLTATHALEQGREVFAVPGNINSRSSAGTNSLIKQGAKLVTCVEDILEELKFLVSPRTAAQSDERAKNLSGDYRKIYDILGNQPIQIDNLARAAGLSISEIMEILLELELNGHIRQLSGKMFVKQI